MPGYSAQGSVVIRRTRKGADGRDSVRYYLTVSPQNFTKDTHGEIKESDKTVTVQAWTCIGSGTPAKANDNDVYLTVVPVSENGTKGSAIFAKSAASCTFTVSKSYAKYIVTLYDGSVKTNQWDSQEVVIGNDGQNSVRLDLDNENDSILYDGAGNKLSGDVVTYATLYDGGNAYTGSPVTFSIPDGGKVNCEATISGNKVTVTKLTGTTAQVTIHAYYATLGKTYQAVFSVKKLVGVDKYDLVVSPNSVSYNNSTGQVQSGSSIVVQVYRTPSNGTGRHLVNSLLDYGLSLSCSPSLISSYSGGRATVSVSANNASANENIVINLTKDGVSLDSETIPIVKATNGTSPYKMDLTNENTMVNCDYNGNPISGAKYETSKVQIMHGNSDGFNDFTISVSADGITHGYNSSTHILNPSAITKDVATITVTATGKSGTEASGTVLTSVMTISKNKPGKPGETPVMFSLIPSHGVIHKDKDGKFLNTTMSFKVLKVEGTTETMLDTYAKLYTQGIMLYCTSLSTAINQNTTSNSAIAINCITVFSSSDHVEFYITRNGIELDREGIDCVYDGQTGKDGKDGEDGEDGKDGKDGIGYDIVFTKAWARADEYENIKAGLAGYAYKIDGDKMTAIANAKIRYGYIINDDDTWAENNANASGFFDCGDWFNYDTISGYAKNSPSIFAAIIVNNSIVCAKYVTIARDGFTGASGSDYLPIYTGLYDSSRSYKWADGIREFVDFETNGEYKRYGVKTKGQTVTANKPPQVGGNSYWEELHTIQTLITNCIFGTNANIGGFLASGQRFLSSIIAYYVRYKGTYSSTTSYKYSVEDTNNAMNTPTLEMVSYNNDYWVPKQAGSFSGQTPTTTSSYWRKATREETACAGNGTDSKTPLYKLELNGLDGIIKLLHEDGYKWEVTKEGIQILGVDSGRHIEIDPNTRELRIYDDNGTESVKFDGETINSINSLFSGVSSPSISITARSGSYSYTGNSLAKVEKYEEKTIGTFTTTASGRVTIKATLRAKSNKIQVFPTSSGGGNDKLQSVDEMPQVDVNGNYWLFNVCRITIYVRTVDGNTTKSTYIGASYSDGGGNNTWITANVSRDAVLPKGNHTIYAEIYYRLQKGASNAAAEWSDVTASFVYDFYLSRIFANGLVFGSSQNNFFSAMRDSDGNMSVKGITNNGKYGFEILPTGLSDIAGGVRLRKTIVLGYGRVSCMQSTTGSYIDYVYDSQNALRDLGGYFSSSREAEGIHKLKFPNGWENVISDASRLFITAIGHNNTLYNNQSNYKVNTTVSIYSKSTSECVIAVGDDMSPNDKFGFFFKIEYMLD